MTNLPGVTITQHATHESRSKGGRAKGANAAALQRRSATVALIVDGMAAEEIAPASYTVALELIAHAADALPGIKVETALDLHRVAQTAEIIFKIARLASGESTQNVAHAHLTDDERRDRMRQLAAMGSDTTPPPSE